MDVALIIGVAAAAVGGVAFTFHTLRNAPLGYQDAAGFHLGDTPAPAFTGEQLAAIPTVNLPDGSVTMPAPANSNVPELTPEQRAVLEEMDDEIGYSAGKLSVWTGLPVARARQAQRDLRDLGLADFGPLTSDEGQLRGSGYTLNVKGLDARAVLRAQDAVAA